MRPKRSLVGVALALSLGNMAFSQDQKPPLPDGPLIRPLPERAAWTVTFEPPSLAPGEGQSGPPSRLIAITKTGGTVKEVDREPSGRTTTRWYLEGKQISPLEGDRWVVTTGEVPPPSFSGFDWISRDNYTSTATVLGQKCYIFEDRISLPDALEPVPVTAGISMDTALPVYLVRGSEFQTYRFGPPPSAPLEVPKGALDLLENLKQLGQQMMRRPR